MLRMSDDRLAELSHLYITRQTQPAAELLDALIAERKMVKWLAEHAACAYKGEYESAEGENAAKWIAAAEEAVK